MNTNFISLLYPSALLLLQSFLILFISVTIARRMGILRVPYNGMEYGHAIMSAAFLFGCLFISAANAGSLFQSFKVYQSLRESIYLNTFYKYAQYFATVIFFLFLYVIICWLITKLLFGFRKTREEVEAGSITTAVLWAVLVFVFSIIIQLVAREWMEYQVPQFINFR